MDEVFPVVSGIVLGFVVSRLAAAAVRAVVIAVVGVALGATASWISGELAISWVYVLVDTLQVTVASVMTLGLIAAWARRARWMPR
jgi:hypothetical protein